jgi:predicted ATP-grasp superfamily ATP-dependent carboligase
MRGPNIVLLAMRGRLGYEVLRALHAMRARVKLICDLRSSIRLSRYCRTLYVSRDIVNESADHILQTINNEHGREPIDLVIASDVAGMMLLNRIRPDLAPPVFPTADNATLALLNNKWRFQNLCLALGIPVPDTIFFESKEMLDPARIDRELGYPVVVKPVDLSGGDGVVVADGPEVISRRVVSNSQYAGEASSLVVQRYVSGDDWGYIGFAIDGHIDIALTFACGPHWRTEFLEHPGLLDAAGRILEDVRYTGVVNFDCRVADGTDNFKFLECNPRFSQRVTATRLCGLNLIEVALGGWAQLRDGVCHRPMQDVFTRRGVSDLMHGRWPLSALATDVRETASDPIASFLQTGAWRFSA